MTQPGEAGLLQAADILEPAITEAQQIKVRLHAAGVNPVDTKLRRNGLLYENALPAVLGCDGAGVVVDTGSAATKFKVGDKVWFCHGGLGGEQGNYAEFNVLDERWAAPMPESLSFEQAAAGPLVLITAWGALHDRASLREGDVVLIHGGTGGVGHVAIQLAKLSGAKVIATVGSQAHATLARQFGADETVNYNEEDFAASVNALTVGKGADVVLDTVGAEVFEASLECTAHFGSIVTLLDITDANLKEARMRNLRVGFELMLTPMLRKLDKAREHHVDILKQCGIWIDEGKLKLHVGAVFPLAEAAQAHALIETGHMCGKAVLSIV
jgi:NADPH2:quinone reductase